jgi:calpain-15
MMEKAFAKAYGSYEKIEAGLTSEALRDITGSSYNYFENDPTKPENTWNFLI